MYFKRYTTAKQLLENMLIEDIKMWSVEEAAPLTIPCT